MRLAGVAQLVEQLICNQQVVGSTPIASSNFHVSVSGLVLFNQGEYLLIPAVLLASLSKLSISRKPA